MPDEPTLGEVMRRLEDVRQDLKDDLSQLATRLDGKVSLDIFELRMKAFERDITDAAARVAEIEGAREREREQQGELRRRAEEQRRADRRLAFSALVAPVLILLLTVYINAQGAAA
ncbi:hypothetical protein ACTWP5_27530 [Streptomyces sp. 4N509B]|uniref:hypothetical protein n=1 Tax=Streptomyces sp. 4N509B TaxID=3457413 RepID=UPI003FCFBB52